MKQNYKMFAKCLINLFLFLVFGLGYIDVLEAQSKINLPAIISCPLQPAPKLGWSLVNNSCGFSTQRALVSITVMNYCNYTEKTYVLCCYADKTLIILAPIEQEVIQLNPKIWRLSETKSKITNAQIQRYTCDPAQNHAPFAQCQIKVQQEQKISEKDLSFQELLSLGKMTYQQNCEICHQKEGGGMQPLIFSLRQSSTMQRPIVDTAHWVVCGKPGTIMHPFGFHVVDKQLSLSELASVITYIRHSWGNADKNKLGKNAGSSIQPNEIQEVKKACRPCCENKN